MSASEYEIIAASKIVVFLCNLNIVENNAMGPGDEYEVARRNPGIAWPKRFCYPLKSLELLITINKVLKMLALKNIFGLRWGK